MDMDPLKMDVIPIERIEHGDVPLLHECFCSD